MYAGLSSSRRPSGGQTTEETRTAQLWSRYRVLVLLAIQPRAPKPWRNPGPFKNVQPRVFKGTMVGLIARAAVPIYPRSMLELDRVPTIRIATYL